uniref:Uncharacterized protein n=1 Tax=Vitis vinifera TaxID=29760 RepID=F6HJ11_VITVI
MAMHGCKSGPEGVKE